MNQTNENDTEFPFILDPDVANTEMSTDGGKVKAAKKPSTRISELPLSKVKHIIKLDPEVQLVNGEYM